FFNRVKEWVIIALASDDCLMEHLVLKADNAMDYYVRDAGKVSRASYDVDLSIGDDLESEELKRRIERTLLETFNENGYRMLDFKFEIRPPIPYPETSEFWGGYGIEFKVISSEEFNRSGGDY